VLATGAVDPHVDWQQAQRALAGAEAVERIHEAEATARDLTTPFW